MNQREIRRLADLLREYGLTEIEIEREGVRVRLRRELAGPVAAPTAAAAPPRRRRWSPSLGDARREPAHLLTIESPMVGTFYRAPSPDAQPFVREGTG